LVAAIRRQPGLEVVSEAGDGSSAGKQIVRHEPDVAVIELHTLGLDALSPLESIAQGQLQTRVLLLSGGQDGPIVYQALEAGAAGWLTNDADLNQICESIATVARGGYAFAPELVDTLAQQIRRRRRGGGSGLTERERAVLQLTADGMTASRVAGELAVSESTVKTHLGHIYAKLGVSCAAAAVYEAMRLDILL
jgi:two-component system nitrate/nitrite response regulator NarL